VPPALTLTRSAFCSHSVFDGSLMICRNNSCYSPNCLNTLTFVIETQGVLLNAGTEFLNAIYMNMVFPKRAMAKPFSCCLVTAWARVQSSVSLCEICGRKVALGQIFLGVLRFSSVSIIPLMLHTHFYSNRLSIVIRRTSGRRVGTFSVIRDHRTEKDLRVGF
jgi:hypothetical protein